MEWSNGVEQVDQYIKFWIGPPPKSCQIPECVPYNTEASHGYNYHCVSFMTRVV